MLASLNWLKEFVSLNRTSRQIADMLTMAGLEVESVVEQEGDSVLDISLTPNRGDCLSILGIAREIAAISGKKLKMPKFGPLNEDQKSPIKIRVENRNLCYRYAGRVIRGVRVAQSPAWLRSRLEACGIRAINNIVDVTNYVMLEFGQPLHAFDSDKLTSRVIRVAVPPKAFKFRTLDGVERNLTQDTLVIWDGDRPSAIAGIMGGRESEVDHDTETVFLESACFDPLSVRKSSSRLGLRTESSLRFERGIDILGVDRALDRASYLISELSGGIPCRKSDVFPRKYSPRFIKLNFGTVSDTLGCEITPSRVHDMLARIGAQVEDAFQYFVVEVPSHRNDLERDVDLVEEVARLHGYPRIAAVPPKVEVGARPVDMRRKKILRAKQCMIQRGYSEVVNFSFMNAQALDLLRIADNDHRRKMVGIMNPLRQEDANMRTTLIPSLIGNLVYNFSRGNREVKLFESSRVFVRRTSQDRLPEESLRIAGIVLGERSYELWKNDASPYYMVKGDVVAMMNTLCVGEGTWRRSTEPFLHPGKAADLLFGGKKAGFIGVLSPEVSASLDIKMHKSEIVVFECDVDMLLSMSSGPTVYERFSAYPYVQRDISVLIDAESSHQEMLRILRSFRSDLIDSIRVFDYYRGKNIPEGKASIAFTVTYRSFERTLSEEEVEKVHAELVAHLLGQSGAELRS